MAPVLKNGLSNGESHVSGLPLHNGSGTGFVDPRQLSFAEPTVSIDDLYVRQLYEDIEAYKHDLDYCDGCLAQPDLTPQESRTLQLRRLDLGHHLRHCRHRIDVLEAQRTQGMTPMSALPAGMHGMPMAMPVVGPPTSIATAQGSMTSGRRIAMAPPQGIFHTRKRSASSLFGSPVTQKRKAGKRGKSNSAAPEETSADGASNSREPSVTFLGDQEVNDENVAPTGDETSINVANLPRPSPPTPAKTRLKTAVSINSFTPVNSATHGATYETANPEDRLQRCGSWRCRLCLSKKYLAAGPGRVPAQPVKWELHDISKMITHFTQMHVEHEPNERCKELGDALDRNRECCALPRQSGDITRC
jgi:hypothetical protein